LVPVLSLVPVPSPVSVSDPDLFSTVFQQQKMWTKSCLFNARISIVSLKVGLKFLNFDFCITFGFRTGTGIHYGSGSAKAKSCGSCGFGFGSPTLVTSPIPLFFLFG
jgi:hypothetical protein